MIQRIQLESGHPDGSIYKIYHIADRNELISYYYYY
jgi:hypothetical protein